MARFPAVSDIVSGMSGSVYSGLAHRLATFEGETYPLHVGDTWMEPAPGCRMEDISVDDHPGMHRYASPQGLPELLDAIASHMTEIGGAPTKRSDVLVAAGATGALGAVVAAIAEPGDELLILSPYWPLTSGIARCYRVTPVEAPFFGAADSPENAVEIAEQFRTERTVALYLNTPNNPTGQVMPREWLEALVEWARQHELWVISDEVYEHYVYEGSHAYARPLAPERTFSLHSFSKAYGMAGNRCGFVIGPRDVMEHLRKISTHTFYSTPTASQLAALRAITRPEAKQWVAEAKEKYAALGSSAAARLGVDPPGGSTFLFLDVAEHLDERGLGGFLEDAVDRGLFVAPGPSFGPYPTHVRVCFTAAEPEVIQRGIGVLASMINR